MLAVRLPADLEKRLDALARRTGRTKTFYAREAIMEHLKELEGAYLPGRPAPQVARNSSRGAASSASSFTSRWKGRLRAAARVDERYQSLAKKYL